MSESYDAIYDICDLLLGFYDLSFRERMIIYNIMTNVKKLKKIYDSKKKEVI